MTVPGAATPFSVPAAAAMVSAPVWSAAFWTRIVFARPDGMVSATAVLGVP